MYRAIFLTLLLFSARCSSSDAPECPDKTCDDYTTQAEAQAAFDNDPSCLGELDDDSDGTACEHLLNGNPPTTNPGTNPGTSNCPTTSSCGCSGKNKDACGGPCCKWTTGQGCGCK
jgi:hypothetical protein